MMHVTTTVLAAILMTRIESQTCQYAGIDLTEFDGQYVKCSDPERPVYIYEYEPCGNNVLCDCPNCPYKGLYYLLNEIDNTNNGACYPLAQQIDSPSGTFLTVNGLDAYTLTYSNGIQVPCAQPRRTNITFICDDLIYDESKTECGQFENESCFYYLNIYSSVACQVSCDYTAKNNGYQINLEPLKGLIFGAADTNNPFKYFYGYTPCQNGYTCNLNSNNNNKQYIKDILKYGYLKLNDSNKNEENIMIFREDLSTLKCDRILGKNNNAQPSYNEDEEYFEFAYEIDDQCDGETATTFVKYYCNRDVPTANITYATNITTCGYEIRIDSRYACVD